MTSTTTTTRADLEAPPLPPDPVEEIAVAPQPIQQTSWCGRVIKHWSQVPLIIGGTACLGYGIYGYVAAKYLEATAAAFLMATTCTGNFYVWKFRPEKSLEDRIKDFMKENDKLKGNLDGLVGVRDQLRAALQEANQNLAATKALLDKKTQKLEQVVKKLMETTSKLESIEALHEKYKEKALHIRESVIGLSKEQKELHEKVIGLGKATDDLDREGRELEEGVGGVDRENDEFDQHTDDLDSIVDQLEAEVKFLQTQFGKMKGAMTELSQHITVLDEADDKFLKGASRIQDVQPKLEALAGVLLEAVDRLNTKISSRHQ